MLLTEIDTDPPLVVDVDDTLLKTDLLIESVFSLLVRQPWLALRMPAWLASGKAALKRQVASRSDLPVATLPFNQDVLDLIRREKAKGRRVFLASAADESFVDAVAAHVGVDGAFASDGVVNLSRERKAQRLVDAFGKRGFDYVGNGRDDLPVWAMAREAIVVDPASSILRALRRVHPGALVLGRTPAVLKGLRRALRPLQWLKNLLVFVPILAAHRLDAMTAAATGLAFAGFSLGASSAYLINDLADVQHDRAHPRKQRRPFASGALPVIWGIVAAPILLAAALALSALASPAALAALIVYYMTTLAYSFYLKRQVVIDVMTLAALYALRIVGGAAAATVSVSEWLLAFSIFIFLALAIVKRCGELARHEDDGNGSAAPAGRGYKVADLQVLSALGAAAGFCAVLVLALYISSDQVKELYTRPQWLWGCCFVLVYWIARMILLSHRGQIHDDPVVFAVSDKASLAAFALIVLAAVIAV